MVLVPKTVGGNALISNRGFKKLNILYLILFGRFAYYTRKTFLFLKLICEVLKKGETQTKMATKQFKSEKIEYYKN